MSKITNTAELRTMLLDVITDVRAGKLDSNAAKAISSLSTNILQSARLDFDVMKQGFAHGIKQTKPVSLIADLSAEEAPAPGEAKAPVKIGA
jgi:hypothetical protein